MLDELALARVDLTAEHVAMGHGSTSSAISARSARGRPLSKQEMLAPVCAALERAQPLTLDVPTLASKGEPPQGSIELGPLPSEVGLSSAAMDTPFGRINGSRDDAETLSPS